MTLAFDELGWGVATGPGHDIGTDLVVMARDDRLFDLGLMIGVQVKTGPSYFAKPARDSSGAVTGWWVPDRGREHIDYWLNHAVPHLIVLHNPESKVSYWAHVTADSVASTGKGAKVLVPRENTIDVGHRAALLAVAATARPQSAWEGSAWTGAGHIVPADRLRYALVVPRLVTPHRNASSGESATAETIVALLVEGRLTEIDRIASKNAKVPALTEAANSPDWIWRFVGALGVRVATGAVDQFLPLVHEAPNPQTRAAATAVAAAGLLEQARPDEALGLLRSTLDRDDNTPVDHAWLTVQHARACLEVGRVGEARASAVAVQQVRPGHADDVTATAIAGTAALLLWTASDIGSGDVQGAITGLDTTAVWWRSQRVASGSNAVVEREFTRWARRSGVTTFASEDVANNRLFTATMLASHLGDHGAWCHLDSLNTRQALLQLDRASAPDRARELLTDLRKNGDDKALEHAVRRLVSDGPSAAVTAAAAEIDLAHWTRTTAATNLTLLRRGGDVVEQATAAAAIRWLLATLVDPEGFVARTTPTFTVESRLVDTLAGLIAAAPPRERQAVAEFVVTLPAQQDQLMAISWTRVVHAIPAGTWTAHADRAAQTAGVHQDRLRLALLGAAAPRHQGARQKLLHEVSNNSWDALAEFGDLTRLPDKAARSLIDVAEARINDHITDAARGAYAYGSHDIGQALVVLNVTHPDVARWEPICALLEDRRVAGRHKREACVDLARVADQLNPDLRARLAELATAMLDHPIAPPDRHNDRFSVLGPAAALAASASSDLGTIQPLLIRLLAGDDDQRLWAAWVAMHLDPPVAAGVLTPLAHDPNTSVRAAAASCLAGLVTAGSGDTLASAALHRCIDDPGTLVPLHIAETLANNSEPTTAAGDILRKLAAHPSAAVRAAASSHPGDPPPGSKGQSAIS